MIFPFNWLSTDFIKFFLTLSFGEIPRRDVYSLVFACVFFELCVSWEYTRCGSQNAMFTVKIDIWLCFTFWNILLNIPFCQNIVIYSLGAFVTTVPCISVNIGIIKKRGYTELMVHTKWLESGTIVVAVFIGYDICSIVTTFFERDCCFRIEVCCNNKFFVFFSFLARFI